MYFAWVAAADRTKVDKPGLVFAAFFLVGMLALVVFASRANHRRSKRAAEYAREEGVARSLATPLPAHTWQPIENPDLSSILGLPTGAAAEQMPAFARFVVRQVAHFNPVENARSTVLAGTTLVVFDQMQEQSDNKRVWVVCGRFGVDLNCPWLELTADEGFGTFVIGGNRIQSFNFEYDDFNQAFTVVGGDQRFAFSLFDGDMMRWFLAHSGLCSLHLQGDSALVVFKRENPATDADAVFAFASGFLARIAPFVRGGWPHL